MTLALPPLTAKIARKLATRSRKKDVNHVLLKRMAIVYTEIAKAARDRHMLTLRYEVDGAYTAGEVISGQAMARYIGTKLRKDGGFSVVHEKNGPTQFDTTNVIIISW